MVEKQINRFVQNIFIELEKQLQALFEMKNLITRQSKLIKNEDFYHFHKTNVEKKKLLGLIINHKKSLHEFKNKWCKIEGEFPLDVQSKIQERIEEIKDIVNNIMTIDRQIYNKLKGQLIKRQDVNENW